MDPNFAEVLSTPTPVLTIFSYALVGAAHKPINSTTVGIEFVEQILPSDGGGLCDVIHISSNAPTSEEVQDETL
eukprot:scaffold42709_cov103-Cyclotella_meneghiniana.AAC.7